MVRIAGLRSGAAPGAPDRSLAEPETAVGPMDDQMIRHLQASCPATQAGALMQRNPSPQTPSGIFPTQAVSLHAPQRSSAAGCAWGIRKGTSARGQAAGGPAKAPRAICGAAAAICGAAAAICGAAGEPSRADGAAVATAAETSRTA